MPNITCGQSEECQTLPLDRARSVKHYLHVCRGQSEERQTLPACMSWTERGASNTTSMYAVDRVRSAKHYLHACRCLSEECQTLPTASNITCKYVVDRARSAKHYQQRQILPASMSWTERGVQNTTNCVKHYLHVCRGESEERQTLPIALNTTCMYVVDSVECQTLPTASNTTRMYAADRVRSAKHYQERQTLPACMSWTG